MEGSTVSLYTNTAAISILHTSNDGYTTVVTDRSSDYRLFDTKLIIVSLSASTEGTYYLSDNTGNTNVYIVHSLTHRKTTYQNNITVFKETDVRMSTEAYNQVVVWYKITAGLLVPVVNTSNRIEVRPSVLLIRNAVTTDQGVYMGKSSSGDWFMFTVTVIDKVDPISYWVMQGDTFAVSLRKQYSDIKWYFMSSTYLLISNSATYTVLDNGQRLVIKNMRENEAGYYQVTYVSGRSPSNVFYELKIGKVIRRTQIHALDGEEIKVTGSSRNPTGWCFKRGSEEPTTPLRMGDVEVVGSGLIISKLTLQNAGTYIYAFGNGDMEVFDIVRVVLPSLLNTMNFWLGQQIELRVRSNQIVSTWYKVSGGILTPLASSVQIDNQSLLILRAELTHQGLYLALTDSNQWLAWRVNVNQEPPNYTTIVAPEGVHVRLDVDAVVLSWYIFPSTSPLRSDSRVQVGSKHLVLRNFDSEFQGFYKAEYRNSQGGSVAIYFKVELARQVSTESTSMVEGRAAYLRTSLPGVTAWYHVGLDGFYTRIQQSSHYHSIATADKYSAGKYYITNSEGSIHMIDVKLYSITNVHQVSYLKGARETLGTGETVSNWYTLREGILEPFTAPNVGVIVASTGLVFQSITRENQGIYVAEYYGGNLVGWDVVITDSPEQSTTLYVPIGVKFGLEVVTEGTTSWYYLETSSTTALTSTADVIVYNSVLVINSFSHETKGYYKAFTTVERKNVDFYFNLLPAVSVERMEVTALIGSDVKLRGDRSRSTTWYSARRTDYVRRLVGEGGWFEATGEFLLIRSINYDMQGEYYSSDEAGNMVLFNVKVVDITDSNTVTVTVLLGSDVILTPKSGVYQLQWYVARDGILVKPVSPEIEFNSQQLSIRNVQFDHEAVYYGFDGTSWFIWRVQVREQPPDYKTYYIPRGSNFALSVPSQGQWYTFSTPTGGPISSSQDFVVKERGSMFIVINFRDELSGYYKFVSTDQKESYILLEAIVSMVSTVEVYGLRGSTVTLQPQTGGITFWIKTLSDQLTSVVEVNDDKIDITSGILTIRQLQITMEGTYVAVDPSGYGYGFTLKIIPEPIQKISLAAILGSSITLSATPDLYGTLKWFVKEGGVLSQPGRHTAVYATSLFIESVTHADRGVYFAQDQSNRWLQWNLDVIQIDRYDAIYLETGTKFGIKLSNPATWTFLTTQNTAILETNQDYILGDSGRTIVLRSFQREQEGFYRATTSTNSHFMFYIRLVLRSVEEVVLYVFYGSRVRLVPRESTLLSKWYSKDENGVVFPVTQNGQGLQSDGNSLVILEVSSFTEGTYYVSNDNGYFKKFNVVGVSVPSEQSVEVMNIIAGNDAVVAPQSVMNVERKWYQIVDGQFTILTDDQKTKPEFDRLTIKNVREEDKGYYATNIGEYWQFYLINVLPFEVEVRYFVKEGKNFGIKLPVDAPNVQWKFYTTAGGTSKNQILDSDSDKLVIKSFSVNNEGFYQATLQDNSSRVYVYKLRLEKIPGSRFEMYVLEDSRVTMTTRLNPPVHWYLTSVTEGVVYARSTDLMVYGNQAVISKVTTNNWGTYYVSDSRGEVDEFVVVLVSLERTELVTRVRGTGVTLTTASQSHVVWYKSSDGMLEEIANSVRVYQSGQNIIIDSIQSIDEGLYIAHETKENLWYGWEVRVIKRSIDSIPILSLPGYKVILTTTVTTAVWVYQKEGASEQVQHSSDKGGSSVQIVALTKKNEGTYNVYFKDDPIESYDLQMVYMLDVQNVEYVLPGTSVQIGTRSNQKTKWIFSDEKVSQFASFISGITEHSTALLVEDFKEYHEGVYHFALKSEGVISHTVYKLVALRNVPVPTPLVMFIGYEFYIRALFTNQPDQIYWYRIDAGVMTRIVPSSKYQLRENGNLLIITAVTVRDYGEHIAVGVFSGGQTQTFRHSCVTHDMLASFTEIERPVGEDVVLGAPNSRSWVRVQGQSVVVLTNTDKFILTSNALTIRNLQESDGGIYIAYFPSNSRSLVEGWKVIPTEPINRSITMYVPAGRPISAKSPFDKNKVQWYKLSPNKQSIGSSTSITLASPTIGEKISYVVENQAERADFTFNFIGVAELDEGVKTVYGVLGFPLKIQIPNTIQQLYKFSNGVLFIIPGTQWNADYINLSFLVTSNQGTYCLIHRIGSTYFYQDLEIVGMKTPLVQQTYTGVFTFDLTLPAGERRVWLKYTQPPVYSLSGERYVVSDDGFTIGSFGPDDVGIYVSISETFQYTWSVKGLHLPTIEQFYRKAGEDVVFTLPKISQHTELNWYKVTSGLLYPLSIAPPFTQTSSLTVRISSVSRAEEGLYVAVLQYSKGGDVVHAFQIFVEEVVTEYEYTMQVIEDQRVELTVPLTEKERTMQFTTTWFRVSSNDVRTELSATNTTLITNISLIFTRVVLGDSGTYQAEIVFAERTAKHNFNVNVNKLPAPFRVLESYVNYNVLVGFTGMPPNYKSVTWHYKKNSDRGIFVQLSESNAKLVLKENTLELNSVQLSDQGYYIAQLLYPDSIRYYVTYLQVNFLPGGDAIVIGYEGQNLTLSVNNKDDALFYTWTYFNSTTGTQLVDGPRLKILSRSLYFTRLVDEDDGYYRINIYFDGGRRDESFIFQLIVLGAGDVNQQCPSTMRFYEKDCAPCQETCSNDKCLFECRSGVCACPSDTPVYYQGKCISRDKCPKNPEYPCSQFGVEGYVYYGSNECAPCPSSCDNSDVTSINSDVTSTNSDVTSTTCTCMRNTCACPADKPIEYKGRCISKDDCPSQQCGGDSNMVLYESECAGCNKTCSQVDTSCSASCLTDVCGCPVHKPYLNPDGWCVSYDYCVDSKPVVCPNNQVFYEQCAPAQRSCGEDVSLLDMISVGCKNKVCACPENKPYFIEGVCRSFCPGISGPGGEEVVVRIVYEIVGEAITLILPDKNSIRRTRWFLDQTKLSSNTKYVVTDSFLTIKLLGLGDRGTYFANVTTNTKDDFSYVFRVFPLQKTDYYVWFEQNPLTISTRLDLNQPLVWLKNVNSTLVNIEDKLMYLQKNFGDLTFVNLQLSDTGHYHATYFDLDTNKITAQVFNVAVIKQPKLQTKTCKVREDCTISVDLYPGWKQVDWYTVFHGVKEYLNIDNTKYSLTNGQLTIAEVLKGDDRIYYGQVTYHSSESYLITYPWNVDVIPAKPNLGLPICNGKSICEVEEGLNIELNIPNTISTGDVIKWYYTIRGVRYPISYVNGRFYMKQGGMFVEISSLKQSDSGQYYAVVTFTNGTDVTINYEITVTNKVTGTTFVEVGFDPCWEHSGDDCMKQAQCGWCADASWGDYRCITSNSKRVEACKEVINPRPTVQTTGGTKLGDSDTTVQLSPNQVLVKMRPGQCAEVDAFARSSKNHPLDVVILQQQVPSVNRGLFNFMAKDLVLTLSSLANTTYFGYGTFSDRNTIPYATEHKNYSDNPCMADGTCSEAHAFRALNYLENNEKIYKLILETMYTNDTISQGNSAFDALYQSLICNQMGWRDSSNKMVIVALYNNPHIAGDGKLGGFVQPFDEVCRTGSTRKYGFTTDYPSIVQVANLLLRNNTVPVFVVSSSVDKRMLRDMIPNSKVFDLSAGTRLDEEISSYYHSLVANPSVTLVDIPPGVNVSYICHLTGDATRSCDNVDQESDITFQMKVCVSHCLENKEETLLNFPAYGQLKIEVETVCTLNLPAEPGSAKCNKQGSYQGGSCSCNSDWVGAECDCKLGDLGNVTQCVNPRVRSRNRVPMCSNRGICQCGRCKCEDLTYGDYCECDHGNCPKGRVEGKNTIAICSGRGTCMCEKCLCAGGYSGEACRYSEKQCRDSTNVICGRHGECRNGRCACDDGYKGKHCQTCTVCTSCEDFETCATCIFNKGFSKCTSQCLGTTVINKPSLEQIPAGTRECTVVVDDCQYYFYHKSSSFFYLDTASEECVEVGAAGGAAPGGTGGTGGTVAGVGEEDTDDNMALLLAVGIILGILFLGILLLICCKACCCTPGSCLLNAFPCLGDLIRRCGGACSSFCSCCKQDRDKYEALTSDTGIPDVVDNPIYEPKKKEVTGDGEDPAAGPVEVDGPASNTYEAPLENNRDDEAPLENDRDDEAPLEINRDDEAPLENDRDDEAPLDMGRDDDGSLESEKPADPNRGAMAPLGPGSDVNPHSLADIDSIQHDSTPNEGDVMSNIAGVSHMSCGVITAPQRHPPEETESVEHIPGSDGSLVKDIPVKKGGGGKDIPANKGGGGKDLPNKKGGPGQNSLKPRDWGGADGEASQYSYDPDEDNFDVDFDQESMTETAPSKQFSWMKTLTPINSLSGIDSNGHHDHKIKSFESLTDTTSDTFKTKKKRRESRMVTIPNSVLLGLGKIPDAKAAIEYDPTVLRTRRLSSTTHEINVNVRNVPYPDIVIDEVDHDLDNIYKDIDSMRNRGTTTKTIEKHINFVTNKTNLETDVEKALKDEQKKLKQLQKEIEKERKGLEKERKRQNARDQENDEQDQLNAILAAVTDNRNVKSISVQRGDMLPSKISEGSDERDSEESSGTISARKLVTILAKHNIKLDDDDKVELMESVTLKGMGGNNDLIEEMVTAKAAQLKRVEGGDEGAIMDLIRSKVLTSGVALPDDIEGKVLMGLQKQITIGHAGISAASRGRFVSEMLEKLRDEIAGGGGLVLSAEQISSMIARVSGKLSVKLSMQQNLSLFEAIKVKVAERGLSMGMLEQWVTKILLKFKVSNRIDFGSEVASLRAALEMKIGASLGISFDDDESGRVSLEQIQAILGKRRITLSSEDMAELMASVTIRGMTGDTELVEQMIVSKALQLRAVKGGDDEAIGELIRSKLVGSGFALPGDMEGEFIAGLKQKMASQQVGGSAASRSKFVAEMLAKLKGDISSGGGMIMTEEQMLSMITRVSNKYSVNLSAQQIQSLIEGIKVKAAQQGSSEGMLVQWVTKILLKFKVSNKIDIESEISSLRGSLQQKIGTSLGLSGFSSAGLTTAGGSTTMRRASVVSSTASIQRC